MTRDNIDNKAVAALLEELGVMIELSGGNPFSARAHYNGARIIESLREPVAELAASQKLGTIKGIGKGLSEKIAECMTTGRIAEYESLKQSLPAGLFDMLRIPGMGVKKVRSVYDKLGISSLGELEYACHENRLAGLSGFGNKSQENILSGIRFMKVSRERHLFHEAHHAAHILQEAVRDIPGVIRCGIAGSVRRRSETIGNIDIVAGARGGMQADIIDRFTRFPFIEQVLTAGEYASVRIDSGFTADLRIVPDEEYPFALFHYTGSKEHTDTLRLFAETRKAHLDEHCLTRDGVRTTCPDEADIFAALGLTYIEPELRENRGEIEAAAAGELPSLVTEEDVRGILHVHSIYSDGRNSVEELVRACRERGYGYLGICDHSVSAFYANGLSEELIRRQHEEIDSINERYPDVTVFKGIESDIRTDGSLDYPGKILETFDFVVASVHSRMKMTEEEATRRLESAVRNPYTTILGHPTGRLLLAREGFPVDMDALTECTRDNNVVIEINANPHRLDLDWRHCRQAKEKGTTFAVNPDSHSIEGLDDVSFGIGIARKGWLEKKDIINTFSTEELKAFFISRKKKARR